MLKRCFLLLCFSLAVLSPAQAKDFDPYETLHLTKEATSAQIEKALEARVNQPGITEPELIAAYYSHSILSHPDSRSQFDHHEPITLNVPPAERQHLEEMLKATSPSDASFLHRTGKVTETMANGAATFYLALGLTTTQKCLQTKNPIYCKEYLNELTDPATESSFMSFILGAHFASMGLKKPLGKLFSESTANSLSGFGGLAAGALTSDVVLSLIDKPEFKALFHLNTITDEKKRTEKRNELIRKIWEDTGGSKQWWSDKVPEITSLLITTVATQQTMAAASKLFPPTSTSDASACGVHTSNLLRTIFTGEGLTGPKKFFQARAANLGRMVLFLEYMNLINPVVKNAWDQVTLGESLKTNRKQLTGVPTTSGTGAALVRSTVSPELVQENGKLWDQSQKKQLAPFEELHVLSALDLNDYDKEIDKVGTFYDWFFNGATNTGTLAQVASWEKVKTYLPEGATLADARKESDPYLRAFFFGPDFRQAVQDSQDWHGIPVPGRMSLKVKPFRAVQQADPKLMNASFDTLLAEIQKPKYEMNWEIDPDGKGEGIGGRFRTFVQKNRKKRVDAYERGLTDRFLEVLKSGILPNLLLQLTDLDLAMKNAPTDETRKSLESRKAEVLTQKNEVDTLIRYYAQPLGKRARPRSSMNILDQFSRDPSTQESDMSNYFKSFLMPEESKVF